LCGAAPREVDGFEAYAPDMASAGGGFKASYFSELAQLEAGNFWFRARNKLLMWALKKYSSNVESMLEIGCGTGFVLSGIASEFPTVNLYGSEIFTEGLAFASRRAPNAKLMQMDARHIPFIEEFDVIGAFDVLEHIKEDRVVLEQIASALKPDGILLITVPQHAWLWSPADEYAYHERRYSRREIEEKLAAAGFALLRSTSFVTALLPAMIASRTLQRRSSKAFDPMAEFNISPVLNRTFEALLNLELAGIRRGLNYPVGGSRLLVAKRVGNL
jgi:SAM-dependent methyltransferase